jgi:heme/copper-type cytochrome/quinol oxidase subunit 2
MKKLSIAFGILIVATVASGVWGQEPAPGGSGETREVQMTAKKYQFSPAVIQAKQGEHIKLIITATDHDHGFECGAFHINQLLKKGKPTTIEFTADKPGTFSFHCSHFCGMGHLKMKGQIIVPASQ